MIKIENLTKRFGSFTAVDDLSFEVPDGCVYGLLGPNGAGKSTTVKCILGIQKPDLGKIRIQDINALTEPEKAKQNIGYVPEELALFKNLTGYEYLHFSGRLYHVDSSLIDERVDHLLEKLQLTDAGNKQIHAYSKGMVQKLAIAAALLHNPPILILDEPFSGLDAANAAVLKEVIRSMAEKGKTVIFCSHILEVVEKLCNQLIILNEGKALAGGSVSDILNQAKTENLEQAFITLTGKTDISGEADNILEVFTEN